MLTHVERGKGGAHGFAHGSHKTQNEGHNSCRTKPFMETVPAEGGL